MAGSSQIDELTAEQCDVPAFTAMYAVGGFADCHFELEIAVAAYTAEPSDRGCTSEGRPTYLPCFAADGDHLPVDCVSGEIVAAVGDRWDPAGEPRAVEIDRPVAPTTTGPAVIAPAPSPECAALGALFTADPMPNGLVPDLDRLLAAVQDLPPDVRGLADDFVQANRTSPDIVTFESLVAELDHRTAATCGLPLVSAWSAITTPVTALPCWIATGVAYPAYERTDCS
ncbi:MAG: hypothetical protein R2695_07930 [Acidimicrobiales bacterium]